MKSNLPLAYLQQNGEYEDVLCGNMLRQHSLTSLSTELPEKYVGFEVPTALTTESSTSETVHNYGRMERMFFILCTITS
jgi:hypothetical protein